MKMQDLLDALGPLAAPFQDEEVQEIMVDGPDQIYVTSKGQIKDLVISFDSPETLRKMIDQVLALAGAPLSDQETTADIRLPDDSRFVVAVPPAAVISPYVMIRKRFIGQMTWEQLIEYRSVDEELIKLLDSAINSRKTILISGGTGSGKTTLLNMIAERISPEQRIVAVQDVHHLHIQHPRVIYLEAQSAPESMEDLIEIGSRMFPSWMVVNELRGPETLKTLQILNGGYEGMASMHADSVQEAFARLESYCLMANQGLAMAGIKLLLARGIQLGIQLTRLPNGKRRILEMVEVEGIESGRYLFQPLTRYFPEDDVYQVITHPSWAEQA